MSAYYNEKDPYAAAWLRNLIAAAHIAPGDVDERSISDVHPDDLKPYTQCHFFAGIGVWSLALRRAGWPDDRRIWTGSCPCQPFSSAGEGRGTADERHLWPHWFHLITQRRPTVIVGEQVASKDAEPWIDLVSTDLEAMDYAVGAVAFPSAAVGAPHKRDRLYFVADAPNAGFERRRPSEKSHGENTTRLELERFCNADDLADAAGPGFQGRQRSGQRAGSQQPAPQRSGRAGRLAHLHDDGREPRREGCASLGHRPATQSDCGIGGLADALLQQRPNGKPGIGHEHDQGGRVEGAAASTGLCGDLRPGPVNGFWRDADWLLCRDGKWRPVEPGTFPLAHGSPARVGRLRAYGNAINAQQAQIFIEEIMPLLQNSY